MPVTKILFAGFLGAIFGSIVGTVIPDPYNAIAAMVVGLAVGWFSGDVYDKCREITNGQS